MLLANVKKTASALSLVLSVSCLVFGLVLLVIFSTASSKVRPLSFNGYKFFVEVADEEAARIQGLSGRDKLVANHGMLFVFEKPGKHCFWMKDMHFGLDMIWLDESKKVVDLLGYVSPETYPESFCPAQNAKYVLEVAAGTAEQTGLKEGTQVKF